MASLAGNILMPPLGSVQRSRPRRQPLGDRKPFVQASAIKGSYPQAFLLTIFTEAGKSICWSGPYSFREKEMWVDYWIKHGWVIDEDK